MSPPRSTSTPPSPRRSIESAVRRASETGEDYDLELELVTARGRRRWVRTIGRPVHENGRVVQVIGAIRDVTAQRIAEAALRTSESRLRSMVDHAPMGIMLSDPDGQVSYISSALLRMCGLTLGEVQRIGSRLTVHPDDFERLAREWGAQRGSGLPCTSEGRYLQPDGSVVWFESTTAPIVVDGNIAAHVVMVQDVTEQLGLEREVIEAVGREQDRLGMELHDGLGQELTGLAISLESLVRKAEELANPLRKDLREMAVLSPAIRWPPAARSPRGLRRCSLPAAACAMPCARWPRPRAASMACRCAAASVDSPIMNCRRTRRISSIASPRKRLAMPSGTVRRRASNCVCLATAIASSCWCSTTARGWRPRRRAMAWACTRCATARA